MDFAATVAGQLERENLLPAGSSLLVGVSGGVDSMALLTVLHRCAPRHRWQLHLAHFNHQLRGPASDQDQAFVHAQARRLGLHVVSEAASAADHAAAAGLSIEMAARELRHAFLARAAAQLGIDTIALAHHRDDQVETFWLKLLRGEAGAGLGGMRPLGRSPANPRLRLLRPFLQFSKSEIVAFARQAEIPFCDDATNHESICARNRLRLEILPLLREFQPHLDEITLRTMNLLADEKTFLRAEAAALLAREEFDFDRLAPALQRAVLHEQLWHLGVQPTTARIESLRLSPGQPVTVRPDLAVRREPSGRITAVPPGKLPFNPAETRIQLARAGTWSGAGRELHWRIQPVSAPPEDAGERFDARAVGHEITLRYFRPGDRFQPIGLRTPVKVQDFLTNLKLPADEKRRRVVALDQSGRLFWIEGTRISELHKVTAQTEEVLHWHWRPTPG